MVLASELRSNKFLLDKESATCYCIVKASPGVGYIYLSSFKEGEHEASLPEQFSSAWIVRKLDEGALALHTSNPFLKEKKDYDALSTAQLSKIDKVWPKVQRIVNDDDFYKGERFKLIEGVAQQEPKMAVNTVLTALRRYFFGGMCMTALAPKYEKCGAIGKPKSTRKISQALVDLIGVGFLRYFLNTSLTLEQARLETIRHEWNKEIHGTTFFDYSTFRRYGKKHFPNDFENKMMKQGVKNAKRNHKLNRGSTNSISIGPGSLFQVDWHKSKIQMVASYNRSLNIGTPYIYCVVDSFSRLLVGVLITKEKPCWRTFMHAIYYAAMNKTTLCSYYNYDLGDKIWLGSCFPQAFIADGEAANIKANSLGKNLGITLAVAESYRGDLKGVVESMHRTMRQTIDHYFTEAGLTPERYGRRLGANGRMEACATLEELYHIAFEFAIDYNSRILNSYPHNADILKYLVDKSPNAIWQWGEEYGFGFQKSETDKDLFLNLLERKKLVPGTSGFCIKSNYFIPSDSSDQQLLENLINQPHGAGLMEVIYDTSYFKNKFWLYQGRAIQLKQLGDDLQEFMSLWDMEAANDYYSQRKKESRPQEDLNRIASGVTMSGIVQDAKNQQQTKPKDIDIAVATSVEIELEKQRMSSLYTSSSIPKESSPEIPKKSTGFDNSAYLDVLDEIDNEIRKAV